MGILNSYTTLCFQILCQEAATSKNGAQCAVSQLCVTTHAPDS